MQFDVVVPTRGNMNNLKKLLSCIALQTLQPQRIIFVVNGFEGTVLQLQGQVSKDLSPELYKRIEWHIVPLSSQYSQNASYARNEGRILAPSDYIYYIDDDNEFGYDFFARSVAEYLKYKQEYKKDIIYSPTIMRRDSGQVQSYGIKTYHFHIGRPEPVIFDGRKNTVVTKLRMIFPISQIYASTVDYCRVVSIGGNSLFGPKSYFAQYPFDNTMSFVYEDIDCLYRMTKNNIPLIVSKKIHINHMERDKTKLEKSFLATPQTAYQKSKNRILFVKKNAGTSQKILFFVLGLPITSIMTSIFILTTGHKKSFAILLSYRTGIFHGLKQ